MQVRWLFLFVSAWICVFCIPKCDATKKSPVAWPQIERDKSLANHYSDLAENEDHPDVKLQLLWRAFYHHNFYYPYLDEWMVTWESSTQVPRNQSQALLTYSIIIPCFNCATTLPATLESLHEALLYLYQQSEQVPTLRARPPTKGEIIFVNDASTDNSKYVMEAFIELHSPDSGGLYDQHVSFVLIHNDDNKGYAGARNTALVQARHEVFLFLDSDDTYEEEHIYLMLVLATMSGAPFVMSRVELSDPLPDEQEGIISNTVFIAKAIRQEVFEVMPLLPEMGRTDTGQSIGGEDAVFSQGLFKIFPDYILLNYKTATYHRHPGNHLDRRHDQLKQYGKIVSPSEYDKQSAAAMRSVRQTYLDQWAQKAAKFADKHKKQKRRTKKEHEEL
eukprot:TRINITY_DN11872_c0_g1_i2.p1 TRINITY_DN11872_c0_g1~~TRINITY_DN11872_c0_g1_i2.p1  ORF type:complete len:390 (-),score=67.47 TRINITY_DN11872_c0_g1_i2:7-1176(-)